MPRWLIGCSVSALAMALLIVFGCTSRAPAPPTELAIRPSASAAPSPAAPLATGTPAPEPVATVETEIQIPTVRRPNTAIPGPTPLVNVVAACPLPTIIAPTSAPNPGHNRLDKTTNLHMTGRARRLDPETYRLEIVGKVAHPVSLTLDELRCLPRVEAAPDLVCPGFFLDTARWAGAPLSAVLALAQPASDATAIEMKGADGYVAELPLADALAPESYLAYEWEGQPLPVLHGFPLRAVLPQHIGGQWVKWLVEINVK